MPTESSAVCSKLSTLQKLSPVAPCAGLILERPREGRGEKQPLPVGYNKTSIGCGAIDPAKDPKIGNQCIIAKAEIVAEKPSFRSAD